MLWRDRGGFLGTSWFLCVCPDKHYSQEQTKLSSVFIQDWGILTSTNGCCLLDNTDARNTVVKTHFSFTKLFKGWLCKIPYILQTDHSSERWCLWTQQPLFNWGKKVEGWSRNRSQLGATKPRCGEHKEWKGLTSGSIFWGNRGEPVTSYLCYFSLWSIRYRNEEANSWESQGHSLRPAALHGFWAPSRMVPV